jgi:hypothetical protein
MAATAKQRTKTSEFRGASLYDAACKPGGTMAPFLRDPHQAKRDGTLPLRPPAPREVIAMLAAELEGR